MGFLAGGKLHARHHCHAGLLTGPHRRPAVFAAIVVSEGDHVHAVQQGHVHNIIGGHVVVPAGG